MCVTVCTYTCISIPVFISKVNRKSLYVSLEKNKNYLTGSKLKKSEMPCLEYTSCFTNSKGFLLKIFNFCYMHLKNLEAFVYHQTNINSIIDTYLFIHQYVNLLNIEDLVSGHGF